ncbi:hypothetical protein BDB01DRAFT_806773 [Pilobolus umbonatus]|nr:hypothetical protein BDB01DRAFT_806773 [Pilobolus umbonatus]
MDFSTFNLEDTGDLFKHINNSNNCVQDTHIDNTINSNDNFFHFMDDQYDNIHTIQPFPVPQLTPDGEGSYTNSSALSGHNPEFAMSPLQIGHTHNKSHNHTYHQHTPNHTYHQHTPNHTHYSTPSQTPIHSNHNNPSLEDLGDDEEFFTPLVSPAIGPTYHDPKYQPLSMNNTDNIFSPLTSPALHPQVSMNDQTTLQQKLAFIERQQQQLRNMHNQLRNPILSSPTLTHSPTSSPAKLIKKPTSLQKMASSPQFKGTFAVPKSNKSVDSPLALKPMTPHSFVNNTNTQMKADNGFIAPATPSLLMKLGGHHTTPSVDSISLPAAMIQDDTKQKMSPSNKKRRISIPESPKDSLLSPALAPSLRPHKLASPRALKPLISPSLKPNGQRLSSIDEEAATALLANKSNYEHLKEGKAKSLGIDFSTTIQSGIQNRRSAHKAAEQKRRDTLKQSFDSLRIEIIDALMEEEKDEELRLHKERDVKQMSKVALLQHSYEYILRLKSENKRKDLKQDRMRQEVIRLRKQLGLPEITDAELEEERREKEEDEMRKEARLKRLSDSVKEEL